MSERALSIVEIARKYAASEYEVRKYVVRSGMKSIGRGHRGVPLYDTAQVRMIGTRLKVGQYGKVWRQVIVCEELEEACVALRATGAEVLVARSIMDGLSQYEGQGLAVIVWPTMVCDQDGLLLETLIDGISLVLFGDARHLDGWPALERQAGVVDTGSYRKLVERVWRLLEQRVDQANLKLNSRF